MFLMLFVAVTAALVGFSIWYDDKETKREEFLIQRIEEKEELERQREEFIKQLYFDAL